jgi:hypothetical protein
VSVWHHWELFTFLVSFSSPGSFPRLKAVLISPLKNLLFSLAVEMFNLIWLFMMIPCWSLNISVFQIFFTSFWHHVTDLFSYNTWIWVCWRNTNPPYFPLVCNSHPLLLLFFLLSFFSCFYVVNSLIPVCWNPSWHNLYICQFFNFLIPLHYNFSSILQYCRVWFFLVLSIDEMLDHSLILFFFFFLALWFKFSQKIE